MATHSTHRILLVLPSDKITGIGGFVDAVKETFTGYGGAQSFLFSITVLGFVFTLITSGAVWMIGADRVQLPRPGAGQDGVVSGRVGSDIPYEADQ